MITENNNTFTGECPFKFLDPYTDAEQEHQFFFGREDEENELYAFVKRTKVLLLYGISGSGKTSLLQCGLSHKFRGSSGWIPIFIRRENNINNSLRETLRLTMRKIVRGNEGEDNEEWEPDIIETDTDILQNLKLLYGYTLRPAFLVFDQFEEFVLMAGKEEQGKFVTTLRVLFEARNNPYFNIIILMREEYFGHFDTIMKDIRGIADWRMRLNPLKKEKVIEVIEKLLAFSNITVQDKENDLEKIYDALRVKKEEVSLSHLQIYLDQFWRKEYKRTYSGTYPTGGEFPPLEFTTQRIEKFGTIDVVLQKFLQKQKINIIAALKEKHPDEPDSFLNKVLTEFINEEGNKRPVKFEIRHGYYEFYGADTERLNAFNKAPLMDTLELLQENRILRIRGESMELAHDSLAKLIYDLRDARYKKQIRIKQRLNAVAEGIEEVSKDELFGWAEYIDSSYFTEDEITHYLLLKEEKEEEYLKARIKKNVVKIAMLITGLFAGTVIALWLFYRYEKINDKQDAYAIQFMPQLNTIQNGKEAMMLAKYLYDGLNDTVYKKTIQDKMLQLAASDNFQRQFLHNEFSLSSNDNLKYEYDLRYNEIMLAGNGSYLLQNLRTNNDTITDRIVIYSSHGVDTIINKVGYPVSNDRILAYDNWLQTLSLYSYANFSSPLAIYPWNPSQMGFIDLEFNHPYELGDHNFIIPFSERLGNFYYGEINGFWRIDLTHRNDSRMFISLPDGFNCDDYVIEKEMIICSAFDAKNDRWLLVYDFSGTLISRTRIAPDAELINFRFYGSSNENVAYRINQTLFVSTDKGQNFNYSYRLPVSDFEHEYFLNLENGCYLTDSASFVSQFDLSGKLLHQLQLPFRIQRRQYDYKTNRMCFETITDSVSGKQYVFILDAALKIIAAYPKTPGSRYFLSDKGDAMATVRNKSIFVCLIPGPVMAFPDFSTLYNWLEKDEKAAGVFYQKQLSDLKYKYKLNKPNFWGI
jgi:hypothetical protein